MDGDQNQQQDGNENEEAVVEKIKVGEEEFDAGELKRLVALGKIGSEAEKQYNTDLTKVWPEFSRAKNEIKELKAAQEELSKAKQEQSANPTADAADDVKKATQELNKILKEQGFMTKDDYRQEREAEKLVTKASRLEKQIDGSDGRPVFRTNTVLQHMVDTGIKDPERAYRDLYEKELDDWKTSKLTKKPGIITNENKSSSNKEPKPVKVTKDNLREMVNSVLHGGREE